MQTWPPQTYKREHEDKTKHEIEMILLEIIGNNRGVHGHPLACGFIS
jgi:hypothetical protein